MSWDSAISAIQSAIETEASLAYIPDARDESMLDPQVGRGKFDESFHIIQDADPQPWRELAPVSGPSLWISRIKIQIGVTIGSDALVAGKSLEARAQQIIQILLYRRERLTDIRLIRLIQNATRTRSDRKIVWEQVFEIVYIK